jgi:hypothetical protein
MRELHFYVGFDSPRVRNERISIMLSLDSAEWANLRHAYGSASDIPELLRRLEMCPASDGSTEPWLSIWSSLAHQGDVCSASFAAIPHIVRVLSITPTQVTDDFFRFPPWIEICRQRANISVPVDLSPAYFEALSKLPELVGAATAREWGPDFLTAAMAALAAGKGFASVAEAALELDLATAKDFLDWFHSR